MGNPAETAAAAIAAAAADPVRILIVDDDETFTRYLQHKLRARYAVWICNAQGNAVAMARAHAPDVILCDVHMPGIDGYEVCLRLKADPALADIPVIFLTSAADVQEEAQAFEVGAADYLRKPFAIPVLEARMNVHIELREAQRALQDEAERLEGKVRERTAELEASRGALREAMHNLRTTRVSTGVYWVQVPEAGLYILCGAPADVVKHLMRQGLIVTESRDGVECETGPNVILLSDVLVQNGRFSNLAEFPVLQMLYRQGMLVPGHPNNTGRKPMLIGSETQVRAQLDYIYRGNYGLVSTDELRAAGLDAVEAERQMALKRMFAFGNIRPSEDLLDSRIVGASPVEISGGVTVRRVALNRYEFAYRGRTSEVDLNLKPAERYESPYASGHHEAERHGFAVIHSGQGDGWDLHRQSMSSIVVFEGRYYLVDAGANVLSALKSLGIDVSEIDGIFHTHAHDDHFAGLPTLMASSHRIKYYATPLVRHSVTKKLAALMTFDEELFGEFFDVRDLVADRWNDCDGLQVLPLHSPHPVENNIFVFRATHEGRETTYAHWADIVSLTVLEQMLGANPDAARALPRGFRESIRKRYLMPVTLKKIDAGGGMIHGDPIDFAADRSEKIVLAHRATRFSSRELEIGSEAGFGAIDVLVPAQRDYVRELAARFLVQIFPEATPQEIAPLIGSAIVTHGAGSLILRPGRRSRHVYLSLSGSVEERRRGRDVALTLPTGSLIGAAALYDALPPELFWRASSPVRLLQLDIAMLRQFLRAGGWYEMLGDVLSDAAFLQGTHLFGERVPFSVQSRIARASITEPVAASGEIDRGGWQSLCLLREGRVELLTRDGRAIETLGPGDFFCEESCLRRAPGPWRSRAIEPAELFRIPSAELHAIPIVMWKLLEAYERRMLAALTE